MANENLNVTLLPEFLKINDRTLADYQSSNIILAGGMLGVLHTQGSSNGTSHSWLRRTTLPTVGFRKLGKGHSNTAGGKEKVTIELEILEATAHEDRAAAQIFKDGPEAYMDMAAMENLATALDNIERQFFYGAAAAAPDGFQGLVDNAYFNSLAGDGVMDGGGAGLNSVWVIRTSESDLSLVGNGENPLDIGDGELIYETLYDQDNKPFSGITAPMLAWLGMMVGSKYSAVRIANVDPADAGIEAKIMRAIGRFPDRKPATHIVMHRDIRSTIHTSRSTFNPSGQTADMPTTISGVPIVTSEALMTNEPAVA